MLSFDREHLDNLVTDPTQPLVVNTDVLCVTCEHVLS